MCTSLKIIIAAESNAKLRRKGRGDCLGCLIPNLLITTSVTLKNQLTSPGLRPHFLNDGIRS